MDKNSIEERIGEIEVAMIAPDFWSDKNRAQSLIREMQNLKDEKEGLGKYDKGGAILTILAGAGGDDAEDFARMLAHMYQKFCDNKNFSYSIRHKNENDNGGFRNISFEITGKFVYKTLKNESGVHRLVRLSPFNADQKRHTSFAMVEVIPKIEKIDDIDIPENDIRIELSKSGGPGGQNVNKRETAVRIVHIPTNISAHSDNERSQEANRNHAMELLMGKLIKKSIEEKKSLEESMQISKTMEIEWGNQIRNYVLHPYKLIKDLRSGVETNNVDKVLQDGILDEFIEGEKDI